jgi:outer membrane protein OmpA-like peptidoglycan-associated protein
MPDPGSTQTATARPGRPGTPLFRRLWPWAALLVLVTALAGAWWHLHTDPSRVARATHEKAQAALAALPEQAPVGDVVQTLNLVTLAFASGKSDLPSGADAALDAAAKAIAALPESARLQVVGYSDVQEPGTRESRFRLALDRAAKVSQALQQRGVPAERLEPIGRGEQAPAAPGPKRHIEFRVAF